MGPKDIIEYVRRKVTEMEGFSPKVNATDDSFFVIANPYDFEEFDNALRNTATFPAVLCELVNGRLEDNMAGTMTNSITISFMVVDMESDSDSRMDVQTRCYEWGIKLLKAIRKDGRNGIILNKSVVVEMNSSYQPVGPLDSQYWGCQFDLSFEGSISWC